MEHLAFVDSLLSPPDDDPSLVDRVLAIMTVEGAQGYVGRHPAIQMIDTCMKKC